MDKATILISAKDDTRDAFASVTRNFDQLRGLAATLGVALSAGAFVNMIKGSIDAADRLNDLSKITGFSVEQLSGLRLAAEQSGVSLDTIATATKKLGVNLVDAAAGNKELGKIFKGLGIAGTDANQALFKLADIMQRVEDPTQRAALAVKLLGKNGTEMIPLLLEGGDALRRMVEQGSKLAPVTQDMAEQADKFNDKLAELKTVSGQLGIKLGNELLPALNQISAAMLEAAKDGGILKAAWVALGGLGALAFTDEFDSAQQKLARLKSDLATLVENKTAVQDGGLLQKWLYGSSDQIDQKIQATLAQIDALQKSLEPKSGKSPDTKPGIDVTKLLTPPKVAKADKLGSVDDYATRIGEAAGKAINESDLVKAQEYADTVAYLDKLFFDGNLNVEVYTSAMDKLNKSIDGPNDAAKRLADMLGNTASAQLEKTRQDMLLLADAFERGEISADQFTEAAQARLGLVAEAGKDTFDELTRAIEGWGNKFTDAFADMVQTGKLDFKSLADSIINDLIRIQIQKNITKPLLEAGTAFFDSFSLPSFDVGTNYVPRDMVAQVHQGEAIIPAKYNTGASGGVVVNVQNYSNGQASVNTRQEGGATFIDVVVEQVEGLMGRRMKNGGGLAPAIEQRYALNPAAGALR